MTQKVRRLHGFCAHTHVCVFMITGKRYIGRYARPNIFYATLLFNIEEISRGTLLELSKSWRQIRKRCNVLQLVLFWLEEEVGGGEWCNRRSRSPNCAHRSCWSTLWAVAVSRSADFPRPKKCLTPQHACPLHGRRVSHLFLQPCCGHGQRRVIAAGSDLRSGFRMAGACCKCPVSLSVFKRSLSVAPRGCGSAPRSLLPGFRRGERGLQEAARPSSVLRPANFYRHTAYFCLSCQESMSETLRTCYVYLNQTSRSFAAVIQALDGELRWVKAAWRTGMSPGGEGCVRRYDLFP